MEVPTRYSEQVVFKYRFCYYSGTVKPTIGMTAVGKLVGDSPFPRGGETPGHGGHVEKYQGWSGGRGGRENVARAFTVVSTGRDS